MIRNAPSPANSPLAVKRKLLEDIRRNGLRRGQAIDSIRRISQKFKIGKAVAEKAVRSLVEDGICRPEHGRGVFLAVDDPAEVREAATIGIVFGYMDYPRTDHVFYRQVYEGMQEWLTDRDFNVLKLFGWRRKTPAQKARELSLFANHLAGIMALGLYTDDDCLLLRDTNLPVAVLDYDTESLGLDCAVMDNESAFEQLGKKLLADGAGEIFLVRPERKKEDDPARRDRLRGLERAIANPCRVIELAGPEEDPSRLSPLMAAAGTGRAKPAAVCDDHTLIPRVTQAAAQKKLFPGRNIVMACVGPADTQEEFAAVPATIAGFDFHKLGRAGADLLDERMKRGPGRPLKTMVPGRIRKHVPDHGGGK
ncbi:MAG: hypothetical protein V1809_02805 [Planctomycetota bacterium]